MRRLLSAALVAGSLTFIGFAPAHAAPAPPVFSNLDSSTPGHVTGTVTSDQPYVWVRLANNVPATELTLSGGTATFDLESWGYGSNTNSVTVTGVACPDHPAVPANCSGLGESAPVSPTDVTPTVTWFADDTIGPGQADPSITVSDTGGGNLEAIFVSDGDGSSVQLAHNGTTVLPVTDGIGYVWIRRCSAANAFNCNDLGFSAPLHHDLEVRRNATATWLSGDAATAAHPNPVRRIATSHPNGTSYSVSWHLADPETSNPVPGTGGTVTGTLTSGETPDITIETAGITDGGYTIAGTMTFTDPDFGTYTNVPLAEGFLYVDKSGPVVTSIAAKPTRIYPEIATTAHPLWTTVAINGSFDYQEQVEIRNAGGVTVARPDLDFASQTTAHFSWNGQQTEGDTVPSGTYTVVVLDASGNQASTIGHVTVDNRQLVTKTLTRTVTAKGSKVTQDVGACSVVKSPSTHGWTGSLSLLSNSKCHRTDRAGVVVTAHALKLPAAAAYLSAQVKVYGGAARRAGGSRALLSYLKGPGDDITTPRALSARIGTHAGPRMSARGLVLSDSTGTYLAWYAKTGAGNRYDVKSFTVSLTYQVLR